VKDSDELIGLKMSPATFERPLILNSFPGGV